MRSIIDEVLAHHVPAGWGVERLDQEVILLRAPASGGMVTVDLARRGYRLGCVMHGTFATDTVYVGRGWAQRLVQDAAAAIVSIWGADA